MEKKSYLIYFDSLHLLELMRDEDCGRLFRELGYFAQETAQHETTVPDYMAAHPIQNPDIQFCFGFMAGNIYRDTQKWLRTQEGKAERRRQKEQDAAQGRAAQDRQQAKRERDLKAFLDSSHFKM